MISVVSAADANASGAFTSALKNAVNLLIEKERFTVNPKCKEIIKSLINVAYRPGTSEILKDNIYDHLSDVIRYVTANTFPLKEDLDISTATRRKSGSYL